jgi:Leucine-rich repeat (LRR) protein
MISLEADVFAFLRNLLDLDLEENRLSVLPLGLFDPLVNLQNLDLEENLLAELPLGLFDSNINLRTLDLSDNRLRFLSGGIFANNSNLQSLSLDSPPACNPSQGNPTCQSNSAISTGGFYTEDPGLSATNISLIVVGSVLAVVLCGLCVWCGKKRMQRRAKQEAYEQQTTYAQLPNDLEAQPPTDTLRSVQQRPCQPVYLAQPQAEYADVPPPMYTSQPVTS